MSDEALKIFDIYLKLALDEDGVCARSVMTTNLTDVSSTASKIQLLHTRNMSPKDSKEQNKVVKINKWDGSAVKNALDDAVKEVLTTKYNYVENFALMDGRLLICGVAVGVAMFALLWDYLYPFPESKPILIFCVSTYFIMMGILTLYTTYKEKGIFAVAIQKTGSGKKDNVWEASSYLKKYDDKYHLTLCFRDGKTSSRRETSLKKSIANFIDTNGSVVHDIVESEVSKLHNSLLSDRKDK